MLCVSINNRNSLNNAQKWRTEIRTVCPDTPIILIATKSDLRSTSPNAVTKEELDSVAERLGF